MNKTPRERALAIPTYWCVGECGADPLPCVTHQKIEQAIQDAIADVLGGGNVMVLPLHPNPDAPVA